MLVGNGDGLRTRKNRLDVVLSLTHPAENFLFRCNGFGGGELATRNALSPLNDLEFPRSQAGLKIGPDLGMGNLAHPATEPIADQRTFVYHCLALEVLVTGEGERFSNTVKRVDGLLLMLRPFTGCAYNRLGLVSEVCCQFPVRGHDLTRRMNLLAVPSGVRSDLGSFLSRAASAFQVFTDLLAAGTRCVEILLRVALDLRRTAPPCRNFVTELAQPVRQLGLIDGSGKLLRSEEALRLNRAMLAIAALGNVENNRVCVQLWGDIAIDRAGCIVLKLGGDKLARGLRRMIAADAGLRVVFELVKGNVDAVPVRFADTLIAADKRGERDRFGRGKGRIPPGSVLHCLDGLALGILIFIRRSLSD